MIFLRTENNYDRRAESRKVALNTAIALDGCDGKEKHGEAVTERVQQSFKEECDINTIIRRFGLSGELPSNVRMPLNGDFQDVPDFRTAMNLIVEARESFDAMPANVRARFHNDPAEFVDFCSDENNREEAIKLGLIERKAAPVTAEAVPGAAVAAPAAPVGTGGT